MKEVRDEIETLNKKQLIKYEREYLEQENQIKSLTLIIDEYKRDQREKIAVDQRVEGKNKERHLLKIEIDSLK